MNNKDTHKIVTQYTKKQLQLVAMYTGKETQVVTAKLSIALLVVVNRLVWNIFLYPPVVLHILHKTGNHLADKCATSVKSYLETPLVVFLTYQFRYAATLSGATSVFCSGSSCLFPAHNCDLVTCVCKMGTAWRTLDTDGVTAPWDGGLYRDADKSLARPGKKQANVPVRMAWISFGALPWRGTAWRPLGTDGVTAQWDGGLYRGADKSLAGPGKKQANVSVRMAWISFGALPCRGTAWRPLGTDGVTAPWDGGLYRDADKSLARPGKKQANVPVRMAWISFGALPCRGTAWRPLGRNGVTAQWDGGLYRGVDKSLAQPGRKKLMFVSEWREFPSSPCLAGKIKLDDISRLDVVEIARVPTCFRACFRLGRAKDFFAPQYSTASLYCLRTYVN